MENFHKKQVSKIVGGTITAFIKTPKPETEYGVQYFGFQVTMPDGTKKSVFILGDEEGNHSGVLDVID